VVKGCRHAKDLIEQILTFSREAEFERRPLQIDLIVKETLKMLRAMFPATIEIEQNIPPALKIVMADPTQIQQLVINLCNNAAHAMGATGGKLMVALSNEVLDTPPAGSDLQPGPYVKLVVSDMGCGIRPEIREHIFEPFFTTKRPGEGTGLGLSVVHGIVINHDGSITMESEADIGTTFQVFLPAIEETTVLVTETAPKQLQTGSERILFVDDEEVVVDASVRILQRLGYDVSSAMSGNDALSIFRAHPDSFDLIITDMTMPGLTGIELARELMLIRPDIPIVLCTGYSQMITPENLNTTGIKEFIVKPFNRSEIAAVIRSVLEKSTTV
jgi:CheY-like chemotaxis protein